MKQAKGVKLGICLCLNTTWEYCQVQVVLLIEAQELKFSFFTHLIHTNTEFDYGHG